MTHLQFVNGANTTGLSTASFCKHPYPADRITPITPYRGSSILCRDSWGDRHGLERPPDDSVLQQGRKESSFEPQDSLVELNRGIDEDDANGVRVNPSHSAVGLDLDGIADNSDVDMDRLADRD